MLKHRVMTAAILLPLALAAILLMPVWLFSVTMAVILLIAAWEWSNLTGLSSIPARLGYLLLTLVVMEAFLLISVKSALYLSLFWWLIALVWLYRYGKTKITANKWLLGVAGWLALIPCWLSLCALKKIEPQGSLVLGVMLLVWGADIGAYFIGKRWGRRKLAPQISPNKSYAGVIGALLTTAVITSIFCYSQGMTIYRSGLCLLMGWLTTLAAIEGDLFESMLKRQRGVKDSGKILPGHGGLLDRIDSLTAAAPVFTLGVWLLVGFY